MDEAIKKARRAFFAFGAIGAFQGQLNPISGRSIWDTLSSKDRELEALRMAKAHQERVVEEMRAQVEVKEEECREKVRTNDCV